MADWSLAQKTPDFVGNAMAAFQAGRERGATRQAGNALAAGNTQGAANAFLTNGMVDQGVGVLDRQRQMQRQDVSDSYAANQETRAASQADRQQQTFQSQQAAEHLKTTMDHLQVLKNVRDQRPQDLPAAFAQIAPIFMQMATTPEEQAQTKQLIDAVGQNPQIIDMILGKAEEQYRVMQGQNGEIGYTTQSAGNAPTYTRLQEPREDPLKAELTRAQIEAQQALAGQRGRSNRGGGAKSSSGGGGTGRDLGSGAEPNWGN